MKDYGDVSRQYHLTGIRNAFSLGTIIGTMLGAMTMWIILQYYN